MSSTYDITNTVQLRFVKMLDTMFLVDTRGHHGELMDGCLYQAFFARIGPLDGWRAQAIAVPEIDQFFGLADFFAARNP